MPAPNHMGAGPRPICITVATRQFRNGMVDVLRHHVNKDNNNSRPWELQKNPIQVSPKDSLAFARMSATLFPLLFSSKVTELKQSRY